MAEIEALEGDEVVKEVLKLVLELIGLKGNLKDIVDDFLVMFYRRTLGHGLFLLSRIGHTPLCGTYRQSAWARKPWKAGLKAKPG